VLVIDDEPDILGVVCATLEDAGIKGVQTASSGEVALQLAYRYQPDVVVLDYFMPEMDGEAVAKGLRILVPGVMILVFSGVLPADPGWADAFLDKRGIAELPQSIRELVGLRDKVSRLRVRRKQKRSRSS
jgi:CheY-like chemotaxis protein